MGALPVMPVVSIDTVMLLVVALTRAGTVGGALGGVLAAGSVLKRVGVDCVAPAAFVATATTWYTEAAASPVSVVSHTESWGLGWVATAGVVGKPAPHKNEKVIGASPVTPAELK
jgi:hypothetical protein